MNRDEMKRLAEGRFSINPPDNSGPEDTSEYAELRDIKHDMDIIDLVLPKLNELNQNPGKTKLLRAVESYRDALEKDAVEVEREFDKKYGRKLP